MDADAWDKRYAESDLVWPGDPNVFVREELAELAAGRALDLAAGEGRHSLWLARLGWQVVATDWSAAGVNRGRSIAAADGITGIDWVVADAVAGDLPAGPFDMVLVAYLQLPPADRRQVLAKAIDVLGVGGRLVLVAHDSRNLAEGVGGPQDPAVLYTAEDVVADLKNLPVQVERAELVQRVVPEASRPALDCVVRVVRV